MLFKLLHTKQLNTALKTATSSRSCSIFSSNSWWEMCPSGNRTRSVRPGGKYRSIQNTKISEIQTGIFGQMERAPNFQHFPGPVALFQDFPDLENATVKFQDFPGFPGPIRGLLLVINKLCFKKFSKFSPRSQGLFVQSCSIDLFVLKDFLNCITFLT